MQCTMATRFVRNFLKQGLEFVQNFIKNIVDKHAPVKEKLVRGKDCQWMTKEIKQEVKNRDYCLKKAQRTNTEMTGLLTAE